MSTKNARSSRNQRREEELVAARRPRFAPRMRVLLWGVALLALTGIVATMMLNSRPESSSATRPAPRFTLSDTTGHQVALSDYVGKSNVLLYFSEGAGCQSCLVQMREIEKDRAVFTRDNVTVLPIVMNSRDQITADMRANGVTTPFLLDDGTVSSAYDTLGKGMHAGLPGHSFVLIDKHGRQVWYGEYPSMWLAPQDLLQKIQERLT